MSARKPAVAKVVAKVETKSTPKVVPRPAAKVSAKSAKTAPARPAASADGATAQEASIAATRLARDIDRALNAGRTDVLSEEALQALMAAVCRSYSARIEAGASFPPLASRSRVTSTDVMVTASGLLKSANLAVFELGMWQSWTGR
jgi:outer membrane biosynthesis protein TonB